MKLKKNLSLKKIFFCFFLYLSFAVGPGAFAQWGGTGTSGDPYLIANVIQLTSLQTNVNGGTNYSGKYFKLTANLDLSKGEWTPIGTSSTPFKGNFDGNGKKITGLYINQPAKNDIGLFGYLNAATISNLGISTAPEGVKGGNNVGILSGSQNGGSITNCYVIGTVAGNDVTGGMVGDQPGGTPTIKQCFAITDVTGGTGLNGSGGLVGVVRGNLSDSYAWSDVTGAGSVGGLSGAISTNGVVNTCYATGHATAVSSTRLGGLTGFITQTSSRLMNSIALNMSISSDGGSIGRAVGSTVYNNPEIISNNYAVSDMKVLKNNVQKTITSNINGLDAGTQDASVLKTKAFYNTTVSWNIGNVNDNTKKWNIWENVNLPYLQTQSSPVNNVSILGTNLQGAFRPDVAMDSVSVYVKNGSSFIRLGTANVNNAGHTWAYSSPALAMNGSLYIFSHESGKAWPSYPVVRTVCALPLTFGVIDGVTYTSALNLKTCIKNLQNTDINDIQFSRASGAAFDTEIIPSPATYAVDGVQTIYARATNKFGCRSEIKSFQVKQIGSLLFKEDFGSGNGCSNTPLGSNITSYTFGGDLKINGNYNICSQLSSYYEDYWYSGAATYDHTNPGMGRSLIVDADFEPGKFYTLKINNLCPGTHLYFSAWVFNLMNPNAPNTTFYGVTNFNDPSIRFELTDGVDGTVLAQYSTGSIPKVTDPATNWRPYGFNFTTGSSSSVILTLYNNGPGGNGNDLMLDDIEVYGNIPPVIVEGPSFYCFGDPLNLTVKNTDKSPLGGDIKVNWLFSEDGSMGTDAKWDTIPDFTSTHLDMPFQKSGYLRAVVGHPTAIDEKLFNCCSMSDPTPVMFTPDLMYWKRDAADNDWNNPDNWVDENDVPLNAVPSKCTDVHIPGNARYYPALDDTHTFRTEYYNEPKCRDITYHFGSEVAKPHYLDYRKAYVQYNFGYYNESASIINGDSHSATPVERGHWYALAAPLKNIVSSDFSVGGFPNFWQQGFKSSLDRTGTLNGDWYTPENTAALEIGARQNYAISVWAGEYLPGVLGEDNHQNLNALGGILQMPYFENNNISSKHRIHEYIAADSTSRFYYYYYDRVGLPVANTVYNDFNRGCQSYRFVFEDNNNKPMDDFAVNVPAGTEIMIGNPFISSLNFRDFYNRNSSVIEDYYRLFVKNVFQTYSLLTQTNPDGLSPDIASFQGFFIKTKGTSGTVTLRFPMSASVTRLPSTAHQLRAAAQLNSNELHVCASNKSGNSWTTVVVNNDTQNPDVPQLFITTPDSKNVPQIYTLNSGKKKNVVQYEQGAQIEVPIGIQCESPDTIKFSFSNLGNINCESLTLTDTRLNKTIDLSEQSSYSFKNEPNEGERFMLHIGNPKAAARIESAKEENTFQAFFHENILEISSSEYILNVNVITLQGVKLVSWQNLNAKSLSKEVQIPAGIYILTVKLNNGENKTKKILIH